MFKSDDIFKVADPLAPTRDEVEHLFSLLRTERQDKAKLAEEIGKLRKQLKDAQAIIKSLERLLTHEA